MDKGSAYVRFFPPFIAWRPAALALATGLMLVVATLPLALRNAPAPAAPSEVSKISVTVSNGSVRLAWSNGNRASYTVYRGDDPRALERGEVHLVNGHSWTDREPATGPIVYYRIE